MVRERLVEFVEQLENLWWSLAVSLFSGFVSLASARECETKRCCFGVAQNKQFDFVFALTKRFDTFYNVAIQQ